jgi:STE24 endopeptidase
MMNRFLILFGLFYFAEHALSFWLTWLNLRHVAARQGEVPAYFRDKITLKEYQKSTHYTHEKTRLGLISSLVGIPIFWGMLLTGFFGGIDSWSRSWHCGSILSGLIFLATMAAVYYLLSLPFKLYSIFSIEQRYGFNKITFGLWLIDFMKGLALTLIVGGPVLAAVLWFMNQFAEKPWWLYVWILLAFVQLFVVSLYPVLIVPLFNKLSPLPAGTLRNKIEILASHACLKMRGIFVMDGSKRSSHSNAFFAGMGRFRRIVLFDTLIHSLSEDELVGVLAHEMGHYLKKHTRTAMLINLAFSLGGLYVLAFLIRAPWFYEAFGFSQPSAQAALFIFASSSGAFLFFIEPFFSWFSRRNEYSADRFAAQATRDPQALIRALTKLTLDNLSNLTPHPLYSFFYYSHPTIMERIRGLENHAPPRN